MTGWTKDDHGEVATDYRESSTEVARARCLPTTRGNGSVRLLVVPQLRSDPGQHKLDDFAISNPLMARITEYLDQHSLFLAAACQVVVR